MKNPLFGRSNYKSKIFLVIVLVIFFMYKYSSFISIEDSKLGDSPFFEYYQAPTKYLINTPTCKIPDIDPFSKDIARYFREVKYSPCRELELLTYIKKRNETVTLHINASLLHHYSSDKITCCYSKIIRSDDRYPDNGIAYSNCSSFEEYTNITHPYIKVTCFDPSDEVYANVHAVTIPTRKQLKGSSNTDSAFSVLLVGIDSISKLNLRRTMPKTYKYLEKHFISLRGYNKIGDNTYPNIMAILTGQNEKQIKKRCGYGYDVEFEQCGFIWEKFKNLGYETVYAEDACPLGIFNYGKQGFVKPPTDYYYRPYMLAAEDLTRKFTEGNYFCAGPESSGERILNIVKDVSINPINVPKFGFFWMNGFSHDDMNLPSAMDDKILEFLNDTTFKASLKNTIMIFFSDHGFRFGKMRYTHTGWLEERLPMMYFYLPDSFKENLKEKYYSFLLNTLRLTTPYDVHNTLQELLQLANNTYKIKKSLGCPNCQSLFKGIDEMRTCKDAAIEQHWCTCTSHSSLNPKNQMVQPVANFIVNEINNLTRHFPNSAKCAKYDLKEVISADVSESYSNIENNTARYFVVIAETYPDAAFEATVETHLSSEGNHYKLLGGISRLDMYGEKSYCVNDTILKEYCYCDL